MNVSPDLMKASMNMMTGLAIVLGILLVLWFLARQLKFKGAGTNTGNKINVLANSSIGFKKNISLVSVPGAILVLGVTQDRITYLTKIPREDWEDDSQDGPTPAAAPSFMGLLKREMGAFGRKGPA